MKINIYMDYSRLVKCYVVYVVRVLDLKNELNFSMKYFTFRF